MYDIISFDQFQDIKRKLLLVHENCVDQFVYGVIAWYQHEVLYPPPTFFGREKSEPPNAFNIIEYPDPASEIVIKLFHESDIFHMMDHYQYDYETAKNKAIDLHNKQPKDRDMFMMNDIEEVLNGYHLFYCYHDDASAKPIYRNPFVKEVW